MSGKGLAGVVVDSTSISHIIPEKSSLLYRGYPVTELVQKKDYQDVAFLLWQGELPTTMDKAARKIVFNKYEKEIKADYEPVVEVLRKIPKAHPMSALRTAISLLGCQPQNTWDKDTDDIMKKGLKMIMCAPIFIAAHYRFRNGKEFIPPRPGVSLAENFLYMCFGKDPSPIMVKTLDRVMILYAEHGFNASTFTARVIASTTSDVFSAVCGAIGSLKGPLHGGANEQVMYMMKEIGSADNVEAFLSKALEEKRKIMGFGHRVYKKGDARVPSLYECAQLLAKETNNTQWMELYSAIEKYMKEKKNIMPNVDFPAGPALYMMGLDIDLFTPIFAMSRIAGWVAHIVEQKKNNRIIRPMSSYTGPAERHL
ncbi:MAG: bifunctional 2-methylcitrate synthase/citrate synthase [Bdellovibrionales bacterium]|nr:bifunctional 2-methylcitrate synthase/citrate synthase [Bdellovibrionales bacterium]